MEEERARVDLVIYKGQTWKKDAWFKEDGVIIDLTGAVARAQIRPEENSDILTAEMTIEIDPDEGHVAMMLGPAQTAAIPQGVQYWDLKLVDADEIVEYDLYGRVIIKGRVTE